MPNSETVKTKLAPKRWYRWAVLVAALLTVVIAAVLHARAQEMTVRLGNQTYTLTRATTKAQKERGLGGTKSLEQGRGMFFWNDHAARACFWMKDMNYSLDIIWLDPSKKIVHIEAEVAPGTYPQTFCHPGQYVIEINAGQVAQNGLRAGQTIKF